MDRHSFETGKRYVLSPEMNTVSLTGMRLVRSYLRSEFDVYLPSTFSKDWTVEKGDYTGTFPTRVKVWLKKAHGKKMTKEQISEVGNIARRNTIRGKEYQFDFTDKFDWSPGDFGEKETSCYWGDHNYARTMLREHESLAIRFYGPRKCRCDCHAFDGECSTCEDSHSGCSCNCHSERKAFWCPNCKVNVPGSEGSAWWSDHWHCWTCDEDTRITVPWKLECNYCSNHHFQCSCLCHQSLKPETERTCCQAYHQKDHPVSGYGRAWVVFPERSAVHNEHGRPVEDWDGFLVFNSYGEQLETTAQVLAAFTGTEYREVSFANQGETGGTLYINDDRAFVLSKNPGDIKSVNLDWEGEEDRTYCVNCDNEVGEDGRYSPDGDDGPYCEDCYERFYADCYHCGETYRTGDMTSISHNYYCEGCREELFTTCDDCDRWTRVEEIVQVIGRNGDTRSVGERCAKNYAQCAVCDDRYPTDTMHLHGDMSLCQGCHSKQEEFEHETEPAATQMALPDAF